MLALGLDVGIREGLTGVVLHDNNRGREATIFAIISDACLYLHSVGIRAGLSEALLQTLQLCGELGIGAAQVEDVLVQGCNLAVCLLPSLLQGGAASLGVQQYRKTKTRNKCCNVLGSLARR